MADTTQEQEDNVLRRMLNTKPKPHKVKERADEKTSRKTSRTDR